MFLNINKLECLPCFMNNVIHNKLIKPITVKVLNLVYKLKT